VRSLIGTPVLRKHVKRSFKKLYVDELKAAASLRRALKQSKVHVRRLEKILRSLDRRLFPTGAIAQ